MARIKLVEPEEAQGLVKEIYEEIERVKGKRGITNTIKAYANHPELLKIKWEHSKAQMNGKLSNKMKYLLGLGLAVTNECSR